MTYNDLTKERNIGEKENYQKRQRKEKHTQKEREKDEWHRKRERLTCTKAEGRTNI